MASQSIGGGDADGVPNDAPDESVSSDEREQQLQSSSSVATKEDLKTLLKEMHEQLLGKITAIQNNEKITQLELSSSSPVVSVSGNGSVSGSGGGSTAQVQASTSSQEFQASFPCANCQRNEQLVQERDKTIATLLSDVLQRLWETRDGNDTVTVSKEGGGQIPNGLGSKKDFIKNDNATRSLNRDTVSKQVPSGLGSSTIKKDFVVRGAAAIVAPPNAILQQEKVLGLFDEVLILLIRQQGLKRNGCIDWLGLKPLLQSCRGVCKSWKRSVDTILENDTSHLEICSSSRISSMVYATKYTPYPATVRFVYGGHGSYFDDNKMWSLISYFMKQQAVNRSYNPIPSRHLKIYIVLDCDRAAAAWIKLSQLVLDYLKAFGTQVWYLTVYGSRVLSAEVRTHLHKSLNQWLKRLPRLKSLSFSGIREEVYSWRRDRGLALLPQLVSYQMEDNSLLGFIILRSNRHVQKLRISCFTGNNVHLGEVLEMELDRLSELSVSISSNEQLRKLGNATWKLRNLSLSFRHMDSCSMEMVLNVVDKFKITLESLTLDLSYRGVSGNLGVKPLDLPRLKHLRIQYTQERGEIRWETLLSELRQLETLEIVMNQIHYDILNTQLPDKVRDFWKYVSRVHHMAHWNNFPKLRSFRLTVEKRHGLKREFCHFVKRQGMPTLRFDLRFTESMDTTVTET